MLNARSSCLGFFLTLLQLSQQIANPNSTSYTAAVVEYSPISKWNKEHNGSLTLRENTEAFIAFIEEAHKKDADIIVFPEYGLTSLSIPGKSPIDSSWTTSVPSATEKYVPCTGSRKDVSESLKSLSCAARDNQIYVVVNVAERASCGLDNEVQCPSTKDAYYYNTNVVFDREGKIIARYRKVNLYVEPRFDKPNTPEVVTFHTDFGVTFGTFICFDLLFKVPTLNLTRIEGVTDIVFSTAWMSELPFLTALQTQYGWSSAEKVNLLASNYHHPRGAGTGSGIYLGCGHKIASAHISSDNNSRLLIAKVPKIIVENGTRCQREREQEREQEKQQEEYTFDNTSMNFLRDNIEQFVTVPLNGSSTNYNKVICDNEFCCNLNVQMASVDPKTRYRLAVFNGVRYYGTEVEAGVRFCSLIQCSNDTIASCASVLPSETTFTSLEITATFNDYSADFLTMPTVLNSYSLQPFDTWTYSKLATEKGTNLTLVLDEAVPMKNISTFGIYVRDFSKDHWNGATTYASPSFIALLFFSIFTYNFFRYLSH